VFYNTILEKAKSAERQGRKATGLCKIAGLPNLWWSGFFYFCDSKNYRIIVELLFLSGI